MGQIEDLRLFLEIVESKGIARAADKLGIAKSAVSRRLALLESRYDLRLVDRQPGTWQVTVAGEELYRRARLVVADADDLDSDFMHPSYGLSGPLAVSIAREFGLSFLKPALFDFIEAHPQIDMTVDFDDRTVDLDAENYDLAVRITTSDITGLVEHHLGAMRHGLFASPAYLAARGIPEKPEDLAAHALLNYGASRRARWDFMLNGKPRSVEFQPVLKSNSGPFLLNAALRGFGILKLPLFLTRQPLKDGNLIPILPDLVHSEFGLRVVYAANRRVTRRMRAFIAALEASCVTLLD